MKKFCKIVALIFFALLVARESYAAVTFEWFRQDATYDEVLITNYNSAASITLTSISSNNYNSSNVTSVSSVTPAIVRMTNTESGVRYMSTDFTSVSVSLQCLASNCTTQAQSCNVTFTGNKVANYTQANKNKSASARITGVLNIPANCGSGTFTGTGTFTPKYGTKSSSMTTSGPTLSFNIIANINSSGASHSINVSSEQDLDFGTMISNTSSSHQVTVSTAGVRTPTNYTIGNDATNGIINVDNLGSSAFTANVSVPASVTMYKDGGSPMTATLTSSQSGSITLNPGNNYINIGGTLTVPAA